MIDNFASKRLYSSIFWFGIIVAVLSSTYVWYSWSEWGTLGIAMVPVIVLSSVFFWWLFIIRPQRASLLRGVLAGLMGFISGPTCLITWTILAQISQDPMLFLSLLIGGLITFAVIILPLRCFVFLLWECAGKLLISYLHRAVLPKMTHWHAIALRLLVAGLLIAFAWFIGLQGSILFLAWGDPGGLLGWYLRHTLHPKVNLDQQTQQPLQHAAQRWN